MRPDNKSDSFTFHRNSAVTSSNSSDGRIHNCRKKLQDRFEQAETASYSNIEDRHNRSVLSVLSLNDTRKAFRNGAEKLSKTFSNVRTTFGTFSQKFKISTKRRQILEEGPMTPNCDTPQTFTKTVLGRTPTQLYSPFSIESPIAKDKENQPPLTPCNQSQKSVTAWQRKRNLLDDIFH